MDDYEKLLDEISEKVPVIEGDIKLRTGYSALYRNGRLYLEKKMPHIEKKVRLAEEYGHHILTVGNIIDYNEPGAWKEELKARGVAVELLVPLEKLLDCSASGYTDKYSCAEHLGITVDFLEEVLQHYATKLGPLYVHDDMAINLREDGILILDQDIK